MRTCNYQHCSAKFIPARTQQRYCSANHRKKQANIRNYGATQTPKEKRRNHKKTLRRKKSIQIDALSLGCKDCGEDDLDVLTFDHVRGTKNFTIAQKISGQATPKELQSEIDKCDVVCANCHMRRTRLRRRNKELEHVSR